jgi:hypothetical protein
VYPKRIVNISDLRNFLFTFNSFDVNQLSNSTLPSPSASSSACQPSIIRPLIEINTLPQHRYQTRN